jgi:hypothetical protein
MSAPSSSFLHVLSQLQVRVRHAVASTGIGERRSRQKGAGMEFADYRPYVPGDDTRHLDARLHARLGDYFVREYEVMKQLPVTIVIDGSRSMGGEKLDLAKWLGNCLGYVALAGGDVVRVAFWSGRRLVMSPRFQGVSRADRVFGWIETSATDGARPFDDVLAEVVSEIPRGSLAIVLSDLWLEEPLVLRGLAGGGAEVWAVHILGAEEIDPPYPAGGEVHLVDSESGEDVVLAVDRGTLASYRDALAEWRGELAAAVRAINGSLLEVTTAQDREKFLLGLRAKGLLT